MISKVCLMCPRCALWLVKTNLPDIRRIMTQIGEASMCHRGACLEQIICLHGNGHLSH